MTVAVRVQAQRAKGSKSPQPKPSVAAAADSLRQTFSRVFGPDSESLGRLYQETVAPLIPAVLLGTNAMVLVHGTARSGKAECLEVRSLQTNPPSTPNCQ